MEDTQKSENPDKTSKPPIDSKPGASTTQSSPAPSSPSAQAPQSADESDALERLPQEDSNSNQNLTDTTFAAPSTAAPKKQPIKINPVTKIKNLVKHADVYVLLFLLLIVIAIVAVLVGVEKNKTNSPSANSSQNLNESALTQLNNNDTQVGGNGQTLTIQADTVFGGSALIKGDLEVAGGLKVGGTLSLPGIQVSGSSQLGSLKANTISIAGAGSVAGQLTVQQNLTVNGPTSFNGPVSAPQITVTNLQINGDLLISHHLVTIGSIPVGTTLAAVGSGGTTSVNGTDTSGTININTGTGASDGCLIKVTFTRTYASTPNIVLTMVATTSQTPPELFYYIEKSASGFTVCSQNTPSNASFGLDYIVID